MRNPILICGTDSLLLSTRRDVLRSVGYDVLVVSGIEEIESTSQTCSIDALVLCHTLTSEQQHAMLAVFHRYLPMAKSVVMAKSAIREISAVPDAIVFSMEGPKALIQTLGRLLKYGLAAQNDGFPFKKPHHRPSAIA